MPSRTAFVVIRSLDKAAHELFVGSEPEKPKRPQTEEVTGDRKAKAAALRVPA